MWQKYRQTREEEWRWNCMPEIRVRNKINNNGNDTDIMMRKNHKLHRRRHGNMKYGYGY
jgi:hypothetical protein